MILVSIPQLSFPAGAPLIAGYPSNEWFRADAFDFGIFHAGVLDAGFGSAVSKPQEAGMFDAVTISKKLDQHSTVLAQFAASGGEIGAVEVDLVDPPHVRAETAAKPFLRYSFQRCTVPSWSTSSSSDDHPVERCTISFEEMSMTHWTEVDMPPLQMSWDLRKGGPA